MYVYYVLFIKYSILNIDLDTGRKSQVFILIYLVTHFGAIPY